MTMLSYQMLNQPFGLMIIFIYYWISFAEILLMRDITLEWPFLEIYFWGLGVKIILFLKNILNLFTTSLFSLKRVGTTYITILIYYIYPFPTSLPRIWMHWEIRWEISSWKTIISPKLKDTIYFESTWVWEFVNYADRPHSGITAPEQEALDCQKGAIEENSFFL